MKVGLWEVDGLIPNLALMKVATYYQQKGVDVGAYMPFNRYDEVWVSKVFDFSPDMDTQPQCEHLIKGGTGWADTIATVLPPEIERCRPAYDLFHCDYALGFTTRGCVRSCPFCLVPRKEGKFRKVADIGDFWNGQDYIMLLDNNLTASEADFTITCSQIMMTGAAVDFSQGLDLRLITPEEVFWLRGVRRWKRVHFAWDSVRDEQAIRRGLGILEAGKFPKHEVMVYVLIGYDSTPEQDLYRVEMLRGLGVDPFVMPFNKFDPYQKAFARWCNAKPIFKSVAWEDYAKGMKGKKTHTRE